MPENNKIESKTSSSQFLKTDGGKTKSNAIEVPSISLPKGGGAIKGIDEKFSVNAVNGTASFSIPLPVAPARGAIPALNLSYNSGGGNSIFGLGWNINLPSIKRKTDKGLPQYFDNVDSDIFLFSEAEDLVPVFEKVYVDEHDQIGTFQPGMDGKYTILTKKFTDNDHRNYAIRFYKPRIEGLFARIERWTELTTGIIKWRVITKDNVTTLFGWSQNSRIADPADSVGTRIYEWLPEFVFDDKGNCSKYFYKVEDKVGFDYNALHNKNRVKDNGLAYTNLYIEKLLYGNQTPYRNFSDPFPADADFLFETAFDYGSLSMGDLTHAADLPDTLNTWDFRPDAFSDYKSGFELRTTRLCKRVLLFHHFAEYDGLVKSLNFDYDTSTQADFTFLRSIKAFGYIKLKKTDGAISYSQKSLPATEFIYQEHEWNAAVKTISPENFVHAPSGLDEPQYQFTDLFNEGLAGILTEQAGGWYYKHNLGNGEFENAKLVSPKPSFLGLGSQLQLADLDANGGKQLVNYSAEPKGYFELNDKEEWQPLKNFQTLPNINLSDANTRMIDLNGDGKADILISEDNIFTWYESAGKNGFANIHHTAKSYDEETGPNMVFADSTQSIFLADMSGDGMQDIVRIRNREVCYWPNLGYGKFGTKVLMDNAPVLDFPDSFNPSFIRLADIDGSGTTDIIYLGRNRFSCWSNLSGNSFNTIPFEMDTFPDIHNQAKISVTDLLGNGVACIVWSSPLAKDANAPLRYIDLMNSKKPHIMIGYKNNMGKEVSMEYKASTQFYIEDKLAGRPWVTKLHFPVHCIANTKTRDRISGYCFVSTFKYHHGYYDHAEREFRGFGMVEQTDAENFDAWKLVDATNVTEEKLHQPPVISKKWTHTGAFIGSEKILNQFEHEYWFEEMKRNSYPVINREYDLPAAKIIDQNGNDVSIDEMSAQDWQEALRACKGMALRSEIFSIDKHDRQKELTPYSVATHNCIIQRLQPRGQNQHAIFIVKESEAITYSYEQETTDPRIAHTLNIRFNEYASVLEAASVVYPRMDGVTTFTDPIQKAQHETYISYVENKFTNDIGARPGPDPQTLSNVYRLRLPAEVNTYQLKGVKKKVGSSFFYTLSDFDNVLNNSEEALYHEIDKEPDDTVPPANYKPVKRLIEYIRTTYRNDNLIDPLPVGEIHSLGIAHESYQLAYTKELLNDIYNSKKSDTELVDLMNEGKFVSTEADTKWWVPSGTTNFIDANNSEANTLEKAQKRFYLPILYTDPYGSETKIKYYGTYNLFIEETEDALGNKSGVDLFNFRTLSPQRMRDINDNLSEAITDELGLVKATAVMGKDKDGNGIGDEADDLDSLTEDTTTEQTFINAFFDAANASGVCDSDDLHSKAKDLLQNATARFVYDFDVYFNTGKPAVVSSIVRETHYRKDETTLNPESKLQLSFEYSNGLGKVIMKKVQAEPGEAKQVVVDADNHVTIKDPDPNALHFLRWIGNGRTILNNKGNPVKQYEPFFSVSPKFEDEKELVETGVTPVMYYDAMSRLIRTEMPNGTFSKVEFNSWKQIVYDENDKVTESDWFKKRHAITDVNDPEKIACDKAVTHSNTPSELHFDTLGRPVLQIENNGKDVRNNDILFKTKIELDIEGNLRKVTDAREITENRNLGNVVMEYKYDMLGNKVYQKSMDAGQRWLMINVVGNPLRTLDERDHEFQYEYDMLHRPVQSTVINNVGQPGDKILNNIFDKIIYGENVILSDRSNEADVKSKNLLGEPILHFDTGGLVETPAYDFKGQPLSTTRSLCKDYKNVVDWSDANTEPAVLTNLLEPGAFTFITKTDALGRITEQTAPDGSVITPSYNEAGLLNSEIVTQANSWDAVNPTTTVTYIKDIDYNEKGQRNKIIYGNDVTTNFYYDKETFRLKRLETKKQNNNALQDLNYTFDPVGNITQIEDKCIPVEFFNNQVINGISEYTYDALYRLVEATGRENNAALNFEACDNWNDKPFMHDMYPGDAMAVRTYTQSYQYDAVGNIGQMKHVAAGGSWTRNYKYETASNRLSSTHIGENASPADYTKYAHHAKHGYLQELPHLERIEWNFKEELVSTTRQHCTDDNIPVITYYQYDAQGQRIRKITENDAPAGLDTTKKEERIYIAGYELYKKYTGTDAGLERTSLSLMDKEHRFVMIETRNKINDGTDERLTRYQLHNHLGSASLELDKDAKVISYEEYHPYGTTAYQAKSKTITCAAKRYRYTGMERDEETGLEYHSARYYLPWLGRWANADPIGIGGGDNIFEYCRGNPVGKVDITGYDWGDVAIGFLGAVVVTAVVVAAAVAFAPEIAAATALIAVTTGVSEATVVTTATAVGTAYGVRGVTRTVDEINHAPTEGQRDRAKGRLPVEVLAAAFGIRGTMGGPPPSLPGLPAFELGMGRGGTAVLEMAPGIPIPIPVTPIVTGAATTHMMMSSGAGGSGNSSSRPSESSGDLRSVDPQGEPFTDPAPPNYSFPSRPVGDHILSRAIARALGLDAYDPSNIHIKTWEANARKGGLEGNYLREFNKYVRQGLSEDEAAYALQDEFNSIVNDVIARPIDAFVIGNDLPNQSLSAEELLILNEDVVCK